MQYNDDKFVNILCKSTALTVVLSTPQWKSFNSCDLYRVLMLGASGVGKTSLCAQFLSSDHINTYDRAGQLFPSDHINTYDRAGQVLSSDHINTYDRTGQFLSTDHINTYDRAGELLSSDHINTYDRSDRYRYSVLVVFIWQYHACWGHFLFVWLSLIKKTP